MFESVSMADFYEKVQQKDITILDVRELDEFQSGHIRSSINIPLSTLGNEFEKLDKNKEYYVICHLGGRSSKACAFLSQQGYKVVNVLGGMSAWTGEIE